MTCRAIGLAAMLAATLIPLSATAQTAPDPVPVMGFYVPWDPASLDSLRAHGANLTWVVPGWISVSGADHAITDQTDAAVRDAIRAMPNRPKLLPMVQNALGGKWYGPDTARLLHDHKARGALLDRMVAVLAAERADGMFVDLEDLPGGAQPDLLAFLGEAKARFAVRHWSLAIAVPLADESWNLTAISAVVDHVVLMAYDEHYQGGTPGPIASLPWFRSVVGAALAAVPADKAIVAIASYAYDWDDRGVTMPLSIATAQALAVRYKTQPTIDPASGNAHFTYVVAGKRHRVWMMTASAVAAQADVATGLGTRALALWRLGTEDAGVWNRFTRRSSRP